MQAVRSASDDVFGCDRLESRPCVPECLRRRVGARRVRPQKARKLLKLLPIIIASPATSSLPHRPISGGSIRFIFEVAPPSRFPCSPLQDPPSLHRSLTVSPSSFSPKLADSLDRGKTSSCRSLSALPLPVEPLVEVSLAHPALLSAPTRTPRILGPVVACSEM